MKRYINNFFLAKVLISILSLSILSMTALAAETFVEGDIYDKSNGDRSGSTGKMYYQEYTYKVIRVGKKWWMTEGLRATNYNDGTPILNVKDKTKWSRLFITGAWCDYNNDPAISNTYGKLYNYHAISTGKLAPPGWRVAKLGDWKKVKGQNFYKTLMGGCRFYSGNFHLVGNSGYFWATFKDFIGQVTPCYSRFDHLDPEVYINAGDSRSGYSVLCVKE